MSNRNRRRHGNLLPEPEEAAAIMAKALGVTEEQVRMAYVEVIRAGYAIAPVEPTNAMMLAYVNSYGQLPQSAESTITAFTKARRRWQAMARMANAHFMSRYGKATIDAESGDAEDDDRTTARVDAAMSELHRRLQAEGTTIPDGTEFGQDALTKGKDDGGQEGY